MLQRSRVVGASARAFGTQPLAILGAALLALAGISCDGEDPPPVRFKVEASAAVAVAAIISAPALADLETIATPPEEARIEEKQSFRVDDPEGTEFECDGGGELFILSEDGTCQRTRTFQSCLLNEEIPGVLNINGIVKEEIVVDDCEDPDFDAATQSTQVYDVVRIQRGQSSATEGDSPLDADDGVTERIAYDGSLERTTVEGVTERTYSGVFEFFSSGQSEDYRLRTTGLSVETEDSGDGTVTRVIAGDLDFENLSVDRRFEADVSTITLTETTDEEGNRTVTVDGMITLDCLGTIEYETVTPLVFAEGEGCPSEGRIRAMFQRRWHAFEFASGVVRIDNDDNGSVNLEVAGCASLDVPSQCSTDD